MTTQQPRPNLFDYATSELSQDAFICWLAAWADPKWKDVDPALHQVGRAFIVSMIRKVRPDYEADSIKSVIIGQQIKFLDVSIEVNSDSEGALVILIEDKIHARQGHNQLVNHLNNAQKRYPLVELIPIYFKTGYESNFDTLGVFTPYLRNHFLTVLQNGKKAGVRNAIFDDFLSHLEQMDAAVSQFSGKDGKAWSDDDWSGFYMALYEYLRKDGADWRRVNNKSGGFMGFWWHFTSVPGSSYMPYLQLEEECLVFKIEVKNEADDRQVARDEAHQRIMKAATQSNVNVDRPKRMGNGRFMTVACLKDDYRVFIDDTLNLDATLANLNRAQQVLETAFLP